MPDRATNIKVNVDVAAAEAKAKKLAASFNQVGMSGKKAGTQVQQGMTQASQGINNAANSATTAAVKFQTLGQGMLNLSTAGVQTFTSFSNLDRAYNRAAMAAVGLDRATDLVNRKQFKLNELVEAGNGHTSKAQLLRNELATATDDLAVKTEKLKIEEAAVLDVQLLFAANIANVMVSSMMIMGAMLSDNSKAWIVSKLTIVKNTIATKLNTIVRWNNSLSLRGQAAASVTATGGLVASTTATKAATVATKALTFALGPVGLIIMGISAALVAYETNFMGFKDSVNGFLGIQGEANEVTEEGTKLMNLHSDALYGTVDAYDKLTTPMKNYNALMLEAARQTGNTTEAVKALQRAGGTLQGFSSGGITTQQGSGTGSHISGSGTTSMGTGGGGGSSSGSTRQFNRRPTSSGKSVLPNEDGVKANPLGSFDERAAFYAMQPQDQAGLLAVYIQEFEGMGMTGIAQAYTELAADIAIATGNFTNRPKVTSQTGDDLVRNFNEVSGSSSGLPSGKLREREFNINQIGFGSFKGIEKDLPTRELIRRVYNIDIGNVANSITMTDAIKIAALVKTLRDNGNQSLLNDIALTNNARAFRQMALRDEMTTTGNFGGRSFFKSTGATAAFQVDNVTVPQWVRDQVKQQNAFNNSGLGIVLHGLQGFLSDPNAPRSTAKRAPFGRSATDRFRRMGFVQEAREARGNARLFGIYRDEDAILAWADTVQNLGRYPSRRELRNAVSKRNAIARIFVGKVEGSLGSLGLDANLGRPTETVRYERVRNGRGYWVRERLPSIFDTRSVTQQLQDDIGVGRNINIPSGQRLYEITKSFATNGMFSNFNNKALTGEAHNTLNITEQAITNIRFNSTRGDRELLNRMRYVELLQANSSGVSSI